MTLTATKHFLAGERAYEPGDEVADVTSEQLAHLLSTGAVAEADAETADAPPEGAETAVVPPRRFRRPTPPQTSE